MWLLLLVYVAGGWVSVGMLTAQADSQRILELHPKAAYALFLVFWPLAWLIGLGLALVVVWALLGSALNKR
ncbi:MAG: hypothetical protein ACYCTZ_13950 [Candidatus Dormibacteria bacterium]